MAETELAVLQRTMEPVLFPQPYGFAVWEGVAPFAPFPTVAETEGLTVVAPLSALAGVEPWARISLTVHSDLAAVGPTAAFASALGAVGTGCDVIAGVHHDHLFVQRDRRFDAMAVPEALSRA